MISSTPVLTTREAARTLGKRTLRFLDVVFSFVVPISAIALIALIQAFPTGTFSEGVVLQMVLAVLGLMAVRSSIERFGTLQDIANGPSPRPFASWSPAAADRTRRVEPAGCQGQAVPVQRAARAEWAPSQY